jgi:hypothetical protein
LSDPATDELYGCLTITFNSLVGYIRNPDPSPAMSGTQSSPHTPAESDSSFIPGRQSKRLKHTEVLDVNAPVVLRPDIVERELAGVDLLRNMGLVEDKDDKW